MVYWHKSLDVKVEQGHWFWMEGSKAARVVVVEIWYRYKDYNI